MNLKIKNLKYYLLQVFYFRRLTLSLQKSASSIHRQCLGQIHREIDQSG